MTTKQRLLARLDKLQRHEVEQSKLLWRDEGKSRGHMLAAFAIQEEIELVERCCAEEPPCRA